MVNINRKYLKERLKNSAWQELLREINKAHSPESLEKVLAKWLTDDELIMLEKRLAIKTLLKAGVRHNEIKRILDVSSHTITSTKKRI